jgi:hypothetical protein
MALPLVGTDGVVVGADISPAMLTSARAELFGSAFLPVAADGHYRSATSASTLSFASWACNSFRIQRAVSGSSGAFCAKAAGWRYV